MQQDDDVSILSPLFRYGCSKIFLPIKNHW